MPCMALESESRAVPLVGRRSGCAGHPRAPIWARTLKSPARLRVRLDVLLCLVARLRLFDY